MCTPSVSAAVGSPIARPALEHQGAGLRCGVVVVEARGAMGRGWGVPAPTPPTLGHAAFPLGAPPSFLYLLPLLAPPRGAASRRERWGSPHPIPSHPTPRKAPGGVPRVAPSLTQPLPQPPGARLGRSRGGSRCAPPPPDPARPGPAPPRPGRRRRCHRLAPGCRCPRPHGHGHRRPARSAAPPGAAPPAGPVGTGELWRGCGMGVGLGLEGTSRGSKEL